jgi:hypothetical protein
MDDRLTKRVEDRKEKGGDYAGDEVQRISRGSGVEVVIL